MGKPITLPEDTLREKAVARPAGKLLFDGKEPTAYTHLVTLTALSPLPPMSTVTPSHTASSSPGREAAGRPATVTRTWTRRLSTLGLLAAGGLAWWWISTQHFAVDDVPETRRAVPVAAGVPPAAGSNEQFVTLSPAAETTAGISLVTADRRVLGDRVTVPGRLDYDARHRVDYASPVDGIVTAVHVQARDAIPAAAPLAEISSPTVGLARDEVQRGLDDRTIAARALDWATTIATNVDALLKRLAAQPTPETIQEEFAAKPLGGYREKLLGGYSRMVLAQRIDTGTRRLDEGGILSGRIVDERRSNHEVAQSNFRAACEEARFQTDQDRAKAKADYDQSDRQLRIARDHLHTLTGSRLPSPTTAESDAEGPNAKDTDTSLSRLALRTPFAGIVEDIFIAEGERVAAGDELFVVADTSKLWVRAQIHERQWTIVEIAAGDLVEVTVPGTEVHHTVARVKHIGATVEADSRSVPLVAELDNDDAHYKPGGFVWVTLPLGRPQAEVAIPSSAIQHHGAETFVFVPAGSHRYQRLDVTTGIEKEGFTAILAGLEDGQRVVDRGSFTLKSELLLDTEE